MTLTQPEFPKYHRFIDETGDPVFFGRGDKPIVGTEGVSKSFGLGIVKINEPLDAVRENIRALEKEVETDELLNKIPSVVKRVEKGGFFFHACKDTPDVRTVFLHYLNKLDCGAEVVMARKLPQVFRSKHEGRHDSFYGDLLSHLIKRRLKRPGRLILHVAERGTSTRDHILQDALAIAQQRASKRWEQGELQGDVLFDIQTPRSEPILCVADYLGWAVQRVFEKGETRFYDYLLPKIRLVIDLYDFENYRDNRNYYDGKRRKLTSENKIGPLIT